MSGRLKLLLVAAVFFAPVVLAPLALRYWQPSGRVNYGELLQPRSVAALPAAAADSTCAYLATLTGRWVLLQADGGGCDETCRGKLYRMRQVRAAQGADMERIERVWLLTDRTPPAQPVLAEHAGLRLARAAVSDVRTILGEERPEGHIYLVDPLGRLVLRYPADADPERMRRDLRRLLSVSKLG